MRFDTSENRVGLDRALSARLLPARPWPPVELDGVTIGRAELASSPPHGGERHPAGDEVVLLVRGRARVHLETDPPQAIDLEPGDGAVVPRGVWHRIEVLEPCEVVYVTPAEGNEHRPPADA